MPDSLDELFDPQRLKALWDQSIPKPKVEEQVKDGLTHVERELKRFASKIEPFAGMNAGVYEIHKTLHNMLLSLEKPDSELIIKDPPEDGDPDAELEAEEPEPPKAEDVYPTVEELLNALEDLMEALVLDPTVPSP